MRPETMKLEAWVLGMAIARILLGSGSADARPEYSARERQSCAVCHVTPWGGGPRNLYGKVYGTHERGDSISAKTDLLYADVRFIDYIPRRPTESFNGLALMEAAVAGNVAFLKNDETGSETRALLSYNLAPLSGAGPREAYVRWLIPGGEAKPPSFATLGRFYAPFGLLTDEHRTYTRMQTNMTENDFAVGGAWSGALGSELGYDVALVNDFQTGGAFTSRELTLGGVLNFRWLPESLPLLLGASVNYEKASFRPAPYGFSEYVVLSLDRLTRRKLRGSLQLERVDAKNWNSPINSTGQVNPPLSAFFIPANDSAYLDSVRETHSVGYYGMFRYDVSSLLTPFYKFDYLALDSGRLGDAFMRHGIGVELYVNPNLILNARVEKAVVGRQSIEDSNVLAAQDDFFAMLRLWL